MRVVLFCSLVSLSWTIHVVAQGISRPAIVWQKVYGGSRSEQPAFVVQTRDGGFAIAGNSDSPSSPGKSAPLLGQNDFWMVRLDASGNKVWDRSYGGPTFELLYALESCPDGGFFIGGTAPYNGMGSRTNAANGDDGWLLRLDDQGNEVWQRSFGGQGYDVIQSLASAPDGGLILGCNSSSNESGNKTEPAQGRYDIWLVALDHAGEFLWQKVYGGTNDEFGVVMKAVPEGGYIIGSTSKSPPSGNKTSSTSGSFHSWVLRLDADGNKLWEVSLGGSGAEILINVLPTRDGGFVVGVRSDSSPSGNKTAPLYGSTDNWIVKLNSAGDILWDRSFGSTGMESLSHVVETADGGLLLVAESNSPTNESKTVSTYGSFDYWLIRLDNLGQSVWQATYGGSLPETPSKVATCTDGSFIVCGTSYSPVSGNKSVPQIDSSVFSTDYWVVKLGVELPRLLQLGNISGAGFHLELNGPPNNYILECSPDLLTWSPWQTNEVTDAAIRFIDSGAMNVPQRFYRLQP